MSKPSRYEPAEGTISYLMEMASHPYNIVFVCTMLLFSMMMLIAGGLALALLPMLLLLCVESLAALFIPSTPGFRHYINAHYRRERRESDRTMLLEELNKRVSIYRPEGSYRTDDRPESPHLANYNRIMGRVSRFYEMAESGSNQVTTFDAEKLDDMSVEFLRMWLSTHTTAERREQINAQDIEARINTLNRKIDELSGEKNPANARAIRELANSRMGLQKVLDRRKGFAARRETTEARMLAMVDNFDELYERTVASPGQASGFIDDTLGRMEVAEELDAQLDLELEGILQSNDPARHRQSARLRALGIK